MLNGLQRRYTLEQIEAQDEALIVPRLNYNALRTLRSPLYKKLGQQVTDTSKEQHETRTIHHQTHQTIGSIANHNGVNAAELEEIMRNLMGANAYTPDPTPKDNDKRDKGDDDDEYMFRDGGGGDGSVQGQVITQLIGQRASASDPERTQGSTLDHWTARQAVPNNEMYRINLELTAANQVLRQEADMKARQDEARRQMTTPHREELRSIVQHFHQATQQPTPLPAPPQDNSQLIGALQHITQQNHALGRVLEEKNMSAQQMVELAHHSMQTQARVEAQTGPNAPVPNVKDDIATLDAFYKNRMAALQSQAPAPASTRMPRSRSPIEIASAKKDTRMAITQPASVGRQASPSDEAIQAEMLVDPRLFSNQPEPARIIPSSAPVVRVLPSSAPVSRILPSSAPVERILPSSAPQNAPSRSRSIGSRPKLPKQTVNVAPTASSSQGEEMRALIAILDGPAQAKSKEPALLQPENPPMPKPKVLQVKKTVIMKQLKAQDKKEDKGKTNEAIRKAVTAFTSKSVPEKTRSASLPPKRQMPTLSFDEIAEQLDSESFLDNPLDRKRDTRRRDEMASRGASTARPAASSSALTRPASSAAVRPASGTRILKTQRADSVGQRRTTLESRLR
jgi:hypothetical protein